MSTIRSPFLRAIIGLDAAACAAMGALFAMGGEPVGGLLGLSPSLMQPVGLFLVAYALFLAWAASRPALPRALVWGLVGFNVLWAAESVMLVMLGWAQPTAIGMGLVIGQAAAALVVADLQFLALKRARAAA